MMGLSPNNFLKTSPKINKSKRVKKNKPRFATLLVVADSFTQTYETQILESENTTPTWAVLMKGLAQNEFLNLSSPIKQSAGVEKNTVHFVSDDNIAITDEEFITPSALHANRFSEGGAALQENITPKRSFLKSFIGFFKRTSPLRTVY